MVYEASATRSRELRALPCPGHQSRPSALLHTSCRWPSVGCAGGSTFEDRGLVLLLAHALHQVGGTGAVGSGLLLLPAQALLQRLPLLLGLGVGVEPLSTLVP